MARTGAISFTIGAALSGSFRTVIGQAASQLGRLGNAINSLSRNQSLIQQYRAMGQATLETRRQWQAAQADVARLAREMANTANPSRALTRQLEQARRHASATSQAYQENRRSLQSLASQLRQAGVDTGRLTQENGRLGQSLERLQRQYAGLHRVQEARAANQQRRAELRGQIGDAVALGASLYGVIRPAVVFEQSMAKLGAITGASGEAMAQLTAKARELGASTQFSASQSAEAMTFLGMAGFKSNAILAATPGLLDLAAAGNMDLAQTADIASNVLSGFGLKAEEMGRVGDVMARTFTTSNVDLTMLGETMKYVAPVASAAGASIEQVAAMAGLLGNVGIQGSMAGTALRATFSRLAGPTGAARQELKKLGVEAVDLEGNLRSVPEILKDFARATAEMGNADQATTIKKVFGEEAAAAMTELLKQAGSGGMDAYIGEIMKAQGTVGQVAGRMSATTAGAFKALGSAMESMAISIGTVLLPPLTSMARGLATVASGASALAERFPVITKTVVGATVGLIGLKVAAIGIGYAWTFIKGGFLVAKAALLGFNTALTLARSGLLATRVGGAVAMMQNVATVAMASATALWGQARAAGAAVLGLVRLGVAATANVARMAVGGIVSFASALSGMAATAIPAVITGFRALGVAVMSNPIGLIIGGIALAAGLIIANWEKIGPFVRALWDGVVGTMGAAWDIVKTLFSWSPLDAIRSGWASVTDFFASLDLSHVGTKILGTLASGIQSAVMLPFNAVKTAFAFIRNLLPFSDAKEGPLSDLTGSGRAIMTTLRTCP